MALLGCSEPGRRNLRVHAWHHACYFLGTHVVHACRYMRVIVKLPLGGTVCRCRMFLTIALHSFSLLCPLPAAKSIEGFYTAVPQGLKLQWAVLKFTENGGLQSHYFHLWKTWQCLLPRYCTLSHDLRAKMGLARMCESRNGVFFCQWFVCVDNELWV